MAQLVYQLPESQKSLQDVEMAAEGLDAANQAFSVIAKAPNSPFPPAHLEQRANMGRNTMKKQLDRAISKQKEYEEQNAARLKQAREIREAEMTKREEDKRKMKEAEDERRRRIAEERQKMQERDRELAERRAEEDRIKQDMEMETDNETGEKKKRMKRRGGGGKRKKKEDDFISDGDGSDADEPQRSRRRSAGASSPSVPSADEKPRKKRKRLERKGNASGKAYKSSEIVVESDESDVMDEPEESGAVKPAEEEATGSPSAKVDREDQSDATNGVNGRSRVKSARVIMDDDDDENAAPAGEGDVSMQDAPDGSETATSD